MSSRSTPPVPPGPGTPSGGSGGAQPVPGAPGPAAAPTPSGGRTAPVLRLEDLTRVHGTGATEVLALRGINLEVFPGELVAVMGPSGSGKSTLLTIAGGLDLPSSGRVVVEGTDLTTATRKQMAALRRRSIGYVFQDYNLIPALTAAENVALPRELDGTGARKARREAVAALDEMGLGHLADRFPDEMSGGQQQRVAIARALVGDRRLVLADEPTGALDSETGDAVLALLRSRCDAGAAGILVTHEPRFAAWADRVVFLRDGSVVDTTLRSSAESLLTGGAVQ
jgi:putative ABC transport system ATP-binding protein